MGLRKVCLVGAGMLVSAGCGLTDTDPPSSAHVTLSSDKPVMLITSKEFVGGSDVTLYRSDTVTVTAKDATYDLDPQPIFLVRVVPTTASTKIQLKVDVGTKNWYDTKDRIVSPPDRLEFIYGYTGTTF
jgi:hypothetical protein